MSRFSPSLREHLERDCTTLCHCWRLERRDGQVLGFTDHDLPLTVDGQLYEPQSGFTQSEARSSLGMAADTVDIEGALSSDRLPEADIASGLFDGAQVETLLVNWCDPSQFAHLRKAVIGKITRADGHFLAELESIAASLDKPNGRYLRRSCDARLGDERCQVSLTGAQWNGGGAVAAVEAVGAVRVHGPVDGFADGWFTFGEITWTSGMLKGRTFSVAGHMATAQGTLLHLPVAAPMPAPGDSFTIVAGCDKSFAACKIKFANPENFRGFPHLPGNDAAYAYVAEGVEFDGRPLVE